MWVGSSSMPLSRQKSDTSQGMWVGSSSQPLSRPKSDTSLSLVTSGYRGQKRGSRDWDDPELWDGLLVVVTDDVKKYEKECRSSKLSWPFAKNGKPRTQKMGRWGTVETVDSRDKTVHLSHDINWVPIRALVGFEDWDEDVVTLKLARVAREAAEAAKEAKHRDMQPRAVSLKEPTSPAAMRSRIEDLEAYCNDRDKQIADLVTHQLRVTIVGCTGLRNADWAPGDLSDPFCICKVSNKRKSERSQFRTQTINDNLNPVWNHTGMLSDYTLGDSLIFIVQDRDIIGSDDLGDATLEISAIFKNGGFNGELPLRHAGGQGYRPLLHVKVEVVGWEFANNGRVRQLEKELRTDDGRVRQLEKELRVDDGRVRYLEKEVRADDKRNRQLEKELRADDGRIKTLEESLRADDNRNKQLEKELRADDGRIKTLEESLRADDNRNRQLEKELRADTDRIRQLEENVKTDDNRVRDLEKELRADNDRSRQLEESLRADDGRIRDLEKELRADNERVQELEKELRADRLSREELTVEIKDRDRRIAELQKNHEATVEMWEKDKRIAEAHHREEVDDVQRGRKASEAANEALRATIRELEAYGSTREMQIKELKSELEAMSKRMQAAEDRVGVLIREHQEEKLELQGHLSRRDVTIVELQSERRTLLERLEEGERKQRALLERAEESERKHQAALDRAERAETKDTQLTRQMHEEEEELQRSCSRRDVTIAELEGEKKALSERVAASEAKGSELARQLQDGKEELTRICMRRDQTIAELQGERKACVERAEAAEAKVSDLSRQILESKEELKRSSSQRDLALAEVQAEHRASLDRAKSAEARIDELLHQHREELHRAASQRDTVIAELQGERRALLERAENGESKQKALSERAEHLEIKVSEVDQERKRVCSQRDQTIAELQGEHRAMTERVKVTEGKNEELLRQKEELQNSLSQRDKTVADLQGQQRAWTQRSESADAHAADLDVKIVELTRHYQEELATLQSNCSQKDLTIVELQGERQMWLTRLEAAQGDQRSFLERQRTFLERTNGTQGKMAELIREREEDQKELQRCRSEKDQSIAELQGERRLLLERVEAAEAHNLQLTQLMAQHQESLQSLCAKKDQQIGELQKKDAITAERADVAEAKATDLEREYRTTCSQRDQTITELQGMGRNLLERAEGAEAKFAELVREQKLSKDELAIEHKQRGIQIAELQGELRASTERAQRAEAKIVDIVRDHETNMVDIVRQYQETKDELQSVCSQREVEISQLKTSAGRARDAEAALARQLQASKDEAHSACAQRDLTIAELKGKNNALLERAEASETKAVGIMRQQQDDFRGHLEKVKEAVEGKLGDLGSRMEKCEDAFGTAKNSFTQESRAAMDQLARGNAETRAVRDQLIKENEELRHQAKNWQMMMQAVARPVVRSVNAPSLRSAQTSPEIRYGYGGQYAMKASQSQVSLGHPQRFSSRPSRPTANFAFQTPLDAAYASRAMYQGHLTHSDSTMLFDALDLNHDRSELSHSHFGSRLRGPSGSPPHPPDRASFQTDVSTTSPTHIEGMAVMTA